MDKLTEQFSDESNNKRRVGVFSQLRELFANQRGEAKGEGEALALDLIIFSVGFLFSRAHLLFGAHPIGIALVALIPIGIWPALIGCVIGALSMGIDGIIFAASAVITVFLRAAISCTDRSTDGRIVLFNETLLLRMCAATLGGFVAALYEVLLSGLNEKTILFGLSMILLPPTLTFAFREFYARKSFFQILFRADATCYRFLVRNKRKNITPFSFSFPLCFSYFLSVCHLKA